MTDRIRPRRAVANGLAMGVAVSLTALTAGLAPAVAKPGDDQIAPTTPVVAPVAPPAQEAPRQETPRTADAPAAPQAPAPVQAPAPAPEPAPVPAPVQVPVQVPTQAPASVEAPAPVETPAPAPGPRSRDSVVTKAPEVSSAPSSAPPSSAPSSKPAPSVESKPDADAPASSTPKAPSSPASSSAPTTVTSAPPTPESPDPSKPAASDSSSPNTSSSESSKSAESESAKPSDESSSPESPGESSSSKSSGESTKKSPDGTVSIEKAAAEIVTERPQTLEAPAADLATAKAAKATDEQPAPATEQDVKAIADVLQVSNARRLDPVDPNRHDNNADRHDNNADRRDGRDGHDWNNSVKQWDPSWVTYDEYYRPVISNPYRQPVKIVYIYQNAPRVVIINPLAQVVLNVAQYAAYSFTAVVANAVNTAINTAASVAVGSFFGGGYFPGYGLPLPPPPPPVLRYDNVPVQVRYSDATYEPFRVNRIVDVGDDPVYGARKVLLDGATPAWGQWTETPAGERMFEVNKTQQFPGLDEPAQGPLPGDYKLRLASDEAPSTSHSRTVYMVVAAIVLAAMSAGAVIWSVMLGRRRAQH